MPQESDYYVALGVNRDASQEEIKQAYIKAAQRLHPDKNKALGETELFLEVQQAYEILSNPDRRADYDGTLTPEEKPDLPITHHIDYSRPNLVRIKEPQLLYVQLEIEPNTAYQEMPAPPLNICLVLDRSTSMKGKKIEVLKAAVIQAMRGLRSQDIFSAISFNDRAEVLIPATIRSDKSRLEAQIRMLEPAGATEIFQGLDAAYKQIHQNADSNHIDHIILVTDGHTYGDEQECLKLAKRAAQNGIGISAMGIGQEWQDDFLDALSAETGGDSKYIARTDDIQNFIVQKFNDLSRTLMDDIVLDFTGVPGAELTYAFRIQPGAGPLPVESPFHLGPLVKDTTLSILFEYRIDPSAIRQESVTLLSGKMNMVVTALPIPPQPVHIKFVRNIGAEAGSDPPPASILRSLGKLTLYRMQEKAHNELENGQIDKAAQHLRILGTNLLAQGEYGLARTVLLEAVNILKTGQVSEGGRKEIKYGTRSLFMKNKG